TIEDALNNLSSMTSVGGTVKVNLVSTSTTNGTTTNVFDVTFGGTLAGTDILSGGLEEFRASPSGGATTSLITRVNGGETIGVDDGSELTIGTSPNFPGKTGTIVGTGANLTKELTGTL